MADALKQHGARIRFVSRHISEHLRYKLALKGHECMLLISSSNLMKYEDTTYSNWLGTDQQSDAQDTNHALSDQTWDWLVVDHYSLDARWETLVQQTIKNVLVIDDLANRPHICKLLLDQNLGRQPQDYKDLVPLDCRVLTGPHYALLRSEFAAVRSYSLRRRKSEPAFRKLIITMGGVDLPNATGKVLRALKTCDLPHECRITVVMGLQAPWLQNVNELAGQMPWPTEVVINVNDIAKRMAESDLAIGAAGSTSWERCCLGLPTLMVVLAENQQLSARAMEAADAALLIGPVHDIENQLPFAFAELNKLERQSQMSIAASALTDGLGVDKILKAMDLKNA